MSAFDQLRQASEDNDQMPNIPSAASTYGVRPPAGIPRRALKQEVVEKVVEVIPSNAMLVNDDGTIAVGNYLLTGIGLVSSGDVSFNEWRAVGDVLLRIEASIQWIIGDWLTQGEVTYGQTYKQIAEWSDREEQTLYNYAWVASKVQISLRKENLSFGHHNLIAGLPPEQQQNWLERAVAGKWSVSRMRQEMAGKYQIGQQDPPLIAAGKTFQIHALKMLKKATADERVWLKAMLTDMLRRVEKGE